MAVGVGKMPGRYSYDGMYKVLYATSDALQWYVLCVQCDADEWILINY